jgi:putative oxidoreductase
MTKLGVVPPPIVLLRVAVAVLLGIHGWHRALSGGAVHFGGYLTASGFPAGEALAWGITGFEIVASLLLLAGQFVRLVTPGFAAILTAGIVMVHGREGWFVVGAGRNGVEFSVLLLVCLVVLFWSHPRR